MTTKAPLAIAVPLNPDQVRQLPRNAVHAMIETLMATLDERDGDPDLEPNGDERDAGVATWDNRDPAYRAELRDADIGIASEDAEDGDPAEDDDPREDDDPDHEHDGREEEHDNEREQMIGDVPCVAVYAIEPSPFNGKRQLLGYSGNNLAAFVSGGSPITAA